MAICPDSRGTRQPLCVPARIGLSPVGFRHNANKWAHVPSCRECAPVTRIPRAGSPHSGNTLALPIKARRDQASRIGFERHVRVMDERGGQQRSENANPLPDPKCRNISDRAIGRTRDYARESGRRAVGSSAMTCAMSEPPRVTRWDNPGIRATTSSTTPWLSSDSCAWRRRTSSARRWALASRLRSRCEFGRRPLRRSRNRVLRIGPGARGARSRPPSRRVLLPLRQPTTTGSARAAGNRERVCPRSPRERP